MSAPVFQTVALEAGVAAALERLPRGAGVGQILGESGRSLVIGRASSLRRWAAGHLGAGPPVAKGRRPRTDLSPVALAVAFAETSSAFQQRLVFERLMARHVPLRQRRDLKPPAWLRLDLAERFPRLAIRARREAGEAGGGLFGPLRDKRAAERALKSLHARFPLRPCDYVFEPDPVWPKGLACLYAQVRSCAAPCLARATEPEYQALAAQVAALLADPARGEDACGLPLWVAPAGSCGLVVETGRHGLELYPVRAGVVLEAAALTLPPEQALAAAERLAWPEPLPEADDSAWLSAWLHGARKTGAWLAVDPEDRAELRERLRQVTRPALRGVVR